MTKRRANGEGSVRRRKDGRWEGRVVAGRKADGSPLFRYVLAATQKELLDRLRRDLDIYRGADLVDPGGMTLEDWLDRWLEEYAAPRLRDSTVEGYRCYIRRYVAPVLGKKKLTSVTAADLQKLYNRLRRRGRIREDKEMGRRLAGSTVRRIHSMLHRALRDAAAARLLPGNPADSVTPPKADYKPRQVLNDAQLDRFMEAIRADPVWYDFFYTEITTGLRLGEICGLRWTDLDTASGTLRIDRTLHQGRGGVLAAGETKTGAGRRKILLPASTAALLARRRESSVSPWIFHHPTKPERPVSPGGAYYRMKALLKQAGLPDIPFHSLRHTFSTHALASGVDAKALSAILGHTDAAFTLNTYTHVTGDMQRQAAAIVGGFLEDLMGGTV